MPHELHQRWEADPPRIISEAKVCRLCFVKHSRHTFGADMVRDGISVPALQHLMGHSQIHTTMLYVHLAPQDVWREYIRAVANRTRLTPAHIS